ncbi:MAG: DUF378 domain-containing protein [Alphaproteobacteria bacterium]|jgi:hypothetical protein|nr:DUF378 domain-containing protein [Alphaproteobacteria bacterium]NDA90005.1 DUF378 domain-containing protein [Alphaproteobacteria bacterium]NDE19183.1 DUF378 domain-containing protein [Alphaproteobacteria bacterium]
MEQNKPEFKLLLLLLLMISAIGAINWGLIGIWNFDLVLYFFSTKPVIIRSIYIAIGIAGSILMLLLGKLQLNK